MQVASPKRTVLCLASYEKGYEFLLECKRQGCRVLLLTSLSLKEEAHWPREALDEIFYMPDRDNAWDRAETVRAVSYLARTEKIDLIIALDDLDLEIAAALREHLRVPGMGETTTRYFRDKLAMRKRAREAGLRVPEFVPLMPHREVDAFLRDVPGPWVLKPRLLAGALGITKADTREDVWRAIDRLGDDQSNYLLERFVPGRIFHVDSIVCDQAVLFALASAYGTPPLALMQGGGIFTSRSLPRESEDEQLLQTENRRVLAAMGLRRGVSHTEFIRANEDGAVYFLETSARVGGANIAELVEAATGLNLWAEWAKLELADQTSSYHLPPIRSDQSGVLISLARQERADTSAYNDPEIYWRLDKKHHVGWVFRSGSKERIEELLSGYTERVGNDFYATVRTPEKSRT